MVLGVTVENYISKIKEGLIAVADDPSSASWSNAEWTTSVKKMLLELAHSKGLKTYASIEGATGKEWLHDFTAMEYSYETGLMKRIVLIVES